MTARVVRDPVDPAFPHGEALGFSRGCTCPSCRDARNSEERAARKRRKAGVSAYVPAARPRRHLLKLNATPTVGGLTHVGACADLSVRTLQMLRDGTLPRMRRTAAARLLAVNDTVLRDSYHRVSPEQAIQQVRALQALGYPGRWISAQLGLSPGHGPEFADNHSWISRDLAARVLRLYVQHGSVPGPSEESRRRAAAAGWLPPSEAASLGYYPPSAYDDDGRLNLRMYPGHPWAQADDDVGRLRDALDVMLSGGSIYDVEHVTGMYREWQSRIRRHLGLIYPADPHLADQRVREVHPGALAAVRRMHQALETAPDGVLTALRLGLAVPRGAHGQAAFPRVPHDHPALLAWRQEQQNEGLTEPVAFPEQQSSAA